MAQRKTTQTPQDNTPDYLVKPKAQFEADLNERIKLGEDMINRQLTTREECASYHKEYTFWNDYNGDFLSRAFNRKDNQYYKDYTYTPSMVMGITRIGGGDSRPLSVQDVAARFRGDVSKHLDRLKKIKNKLGLIDELPGLQPAQASESVNKQEEGLNYLSTIFSKFNRVAQHLRHRHADRETIVIKDEYDVQDLLHSLLHLHFSDIRAEDYSPSYAGGNSRVDFTLKDEKIVVEVKMTNDHLKDKEIGNQLLIDIGRYRGHPDCEVLAVFVYDKLDNIRNKAGLIADLERMSSPGLKVRVFIEPKY